MLAVTKASAAAPIQPLAQELPCAAGAAIKRKKEREKKSVPFTTHQVGGGSGTPPCEAGGGWGGQGVFQRFCRPDAGPLLSKERAIG